MLPPSLSNKLPAQGGAINNEVREGTLMSADGPSLSEIVARARVASGLNATDSTGITSNNGLDKDVVMSDAHVSEPANVNDNGSHPSKTKIEQPPQKIQTPDHPTPPLKPSAHGMLIDRLKTTTHGMLAVPPVIKTDINVVMPGENGKTRHPLPGRNFRLPATPNYPEGGYRPKPQSLQTAVATTETATKIVSEEASEESTTIKIRTPLTTATGTEEKRAPFLCFPSEAAAPFRYPNAAAQFLNVRPGGKFASGAIGKFGEKSNVTPSAGAQPLQGPGFQLGARSGAIPPLSVETSEKADTVIGKRIDHHHPVGPLGGRGRSLGTVQVTQGFSVKPPSEPNNNGAETTATVGVSALGGILSSQNPKLVQGTQQQQPPHRLSMQAMPVITGNSKPPTLALTVGATMTKGNASGDLSTGGMSNPAKHGVGNAAGAGVMGNTNMNGGPTPPPPQVQPQRQPAGSQIMPGMRELRVEDALLYLDEVKKEFGGRPRVYNEFLAIMKNFKSQTVDTPGVIDRVSKLFRGNNHLILGFNKFLPDGYKISMDDLKQMDAAHAREQEIMRQEQAAIAEKGQQQQPQQQQMKVQIPLQQQRSTPEQQHQMQQKQGLPPPHVAAIPPPQQIAMQQKQQQPTQIRDVPIRGAFAEHAAARQRMILATDAQEKQRQPQAVLKQPKGKAGKAAKKQQQQQLQVLAQPQVSPQQLPPPPQQPQQLPGQLVEFDHAISYVTTIKRRFATDENTYRQFLEILHTYQKEQKGIKEVLEQVAHLFQDHPDLLKEFTFFLPDSVQEQAKERLHRAAAESESRLSAQKNINTKSTEPLWRNSLELVDNFDSVDPPDQSSEVDHTRAMMVDQVEAPKQKRYKDVQRPQVLISFQQRPETFVYNSAVERQFFDAAKEALASYTRDGGQAWAEFLKCLDMYAQDILSKSEMLNFVEPLLGKRNNKLFEEFKRILAAAGGQGMSTVPSMEDSWYSVPLSEIDFSRCRKCSPSYRALPRDYPAPPCSQRSDEEAKVLNNVWVSLPVGNEETFRHMRRNTHEETLFRIEDERFEIDMTIDSNRCTLALLEPFAQEMAQLSGEDSRMQSDKENESKRNAERKGLGGKRFRYTFDPSILGVIHRNSITRIYGDSGPEMLELLKTNPSVAIPITVSRLKQKDIEWRAVRVRLNRHWRDLAQASYYKSLDHRGLTWRTTDKKAISNRTLLADIKDRAANNGNESKFAYEARVQKAKEEHGTFFLTTMGNDFKRIIDLSKLPKPDRKLFTPDMRLMYENSSCIQKDVYRILSFALERGPISPIDKERCHRLWTEFLGPWFNLKLNWMLEPAVAFQETSTSTIRLPRVVNKDDNSQDEDEDESPDEDGEIKARKIITEESRDDGNDDNSDTPLSVDHHPLPAGTTVSTIYGDGRIISCRKEDNMYVVKLAFGTSYLRPSAVLVSVLEAEKSAYTTHRMVDDHTKLDRPDDKLVIGTQSLYLFFRLHQILCRRVGIARRLAYEVKNDPSLQTLVEQMPGQCGAEAGKRRYDAFLSLVYALLDGGTGSSEGAKFEDRVRTLLGHWGYELATLDKLISHILKNIQNMAYDDTMWSLVQLFRRHINAGGFKPEALRQEAAYLSDGEPMYAFQYCPIQKDRGEKAVLYVESLGVIVGSEEEDSLSDRAQEPSSKRQRR